MDSWEIHYYGVLQSFRLGPLGIAHALDFLLLFFVLGLYFFKEELVKDEALFLFSSFVVCVLLLYTPNPPRALACTKGNPDEFLYYI